MQTNFKKIFMRIYYVVVNIIIIITKCYCTRNCSSCAQKGKIQIFDEYVVTTLSTNCAYCVFDITHIIRV